MSALRKIASRLFGADPVFARNTAGGISPPSFKQRSLRSRIMATPLPPQLKIPIGPAHGGAITLLVETGQRVRKYQLLARIQSPFDEGGYIPVHAPSSGTVSHIGPAAVADHREPEQLCVQLKTDGKDEALTLDGVVDFSRLSRTQIGARIRDAGIVGMGGAGFPTADKLNLAEQLAIDLLIINAAECEPYISADEALIRERAGQTITGAEVLRQACSANRTIIAIEASKSDAVAALRHALRSIDHSEHSCSIVLLPGKYPAGSERQLIQCVTGIELPAEQLPAHSGILMQNIGSAYAAYEAIVLGRPCVSRITTLCGEALQTPKNFEALIGTPASFLFELCGTDPALPHRSVVGGSLMGRELDGDDAVVGKTTNCLIAAGPGDFPATAAEQACIRCGFCADACPVRLLPQQLLAASKTADSHALLDHGLFDCIECGACDYVCPSHIPLVSIYKHSKNAIAARDQQLALSEHWQRRFQQHQYRLKREKDQSLARKTGRSKKKPQARPAEPGDAQPPTPETFSREKASREIAAAVARVKARRAENTAAGRDPAAKDEKRR